MFAKFVSKDNLYHYTAMYLLSLLIFFNCVAVYAYYHCWVEHSKNIYPSRTIVIIFLFSIALINYLVFVKGRMYESLFEKFLKNEKFKRFQGTLIAVFYIIASLMIFISSIWLKCK